MKIRLGHLKPAAATLAVGAILASLAPALTAMGAHSVPKPPPVPVGHHSVPKPPPVPVGHHSVPKPCPLPGRGLPVGHHSQPQICHR